MIYSLLVPLVGVRCKAITKNDNLGGDKKLAIIIR